mmetsp:Transcript_16789/g.36630  ORF Transcript_16789/g.36630 Transcript_16789/m.36630 type:complete len:220 (+) Transcript_16789:4080-4739(+)
MLNNIPGSTCGKEFLTEIVAALSVTIPSPPPPFDCCCCCCCFVLALALRVRVRFHCQQSICRSVLDLVVVVPDGSCVRFVIDVDDVSVVIKLRGGNTGGGCLEVTIGGGSTPGIVIYFVIVVVTTTSTSTTRSRGGSTVFQIHGAPRAAGGWMLAADFSTKRRKALLEADGRRCPGNLGGRCHGRWIGICTCIGIGIGVPLGRVVGAGFRSRRRRRRRV